MWKDDATAADILLAAQDIQRFAAGLSYADFLKNDLVQAAVVQRILMMGEAAKRLSEEFRTNHPGIEWRQIAVCATAVSIATTKLSWKLFGRLSLLMRRQSSGI